MDKTSNATAAAYADLACRYSNLFQYNPAAAAAAAACAAAAYGMLNNQPQNNQTTTTNNTEQQSKELTKLNNGSTSSSVNSISSPTNSLTSSLSQSSTVSNNNKFNNVVIKQKIEEEQVDKLEQLDSKKEDLMKQNVKNSDSFEDDDQELDDQDDVFSDLNSTMSHNDRDDFNLDEANNIDLIVSNETDEPIGKKQKLTHSRSSSASSIMSRQSSLVSQSSSMISNNSSYLLNVTRADDEANKLYSKKSLDKIQHNLELDAEKAIVTCFDKNQVKTESDDSVQQTQTNQNGSISIGSILNSLTTTDDFKITKSDLDQFKFQLITSVNQAIHKAFETFYEIKIKTNRTPIVNTQQSSTNVTTTPIINSQQKSSSFNMSKLLETTTTNKQANDLSQKRKLINDVQSNKHSAANLLLTTSKHSAFNSPNKQNQAPLNAAAMSHFYSAAMSHLQQNNKSNFSNVQNGLLNSTSLNPLLSSGLPPPPPPPMPSQQAQHNISSQNNNQFLLSLAAHQNNGQQQQQHSAYLNNLANRLFTPYLIDNHKSYQPTAPQQFNHQMQQQTRHITPSGKRRRTKVTDTRLSPRNPAAAAALAAANQISRSLLYQPSSFLTKKQQLKEDDQENDCDSDNDELATHSSSNRQQNEDNESLSNGCTVNDTSYVSSHQHHHQLATMPNGCFSSSFQHDDNMEMMNSINGNNGSMSSSSSSTNEYYNGYQTSTLSSLHLRKAKLMFFFTRYPSSTILRNYFPDVKFNKANTAQLVKWFSNFREFFYIQMEKHARQHLAEGVQHAEDLHVDIDSEIFRALNSHYNRNNQLEIPTSFCYVIEQTLREFFRAIQENKDLDPSWKKSIYKVIARMDDSLPDFFKSIKWMETLETSIGGSVTGLGGIV